MRHLLFVLLCAACAPDDTPTWGTQTVWIGHDAQDQLVGFHTWSLFGPGFERGAKPRHFACSAVFLLTLEPDDTCAACTSAWRVTEEWADGDCDESVLPDELGLTGVGLGAVPDELRGQEPYPDVEGRHLRALRRHGVDAPWVGLPWCGERGARRRVPVPGRPGAHRLARLELQPGPVTAATSRSRPGHHAGRQRPDDCARNEIEPLA